jgi:murein DD-endopeptidase MepM/ murein hydrolase activator NlpD
MWTTTTTEALRGSSRKSSIRRAVIFVFAAALVLAEESPAQQLFKYRDENGAWAYSDIPPENRDVELLELEIADDSAEVTLVRQDRSDGGVALLARSTYYSPVQIAFELTRMENLHEQTPQRGNRILPPRSETELLVARPKDQRAAMALQYSFEYLPGDPRATHSPPGGYRVPFAIASSHIVSQAYPSRVTHSDRSSWHAIDFAVPVGTDVYAARGGTVIEVASDFFESGQDLERDGSRANIVRILHDDGTMSLYAHLNWNSIRVRPGQAVARGEYIAESGNTGYSTGPHLHFVVQRNEGGALVSVPVSFAGPGGRLVDVGVGDKITAY